MSEKDCTTTLLPGGSEVEQAMHTVTCALAFLRTDLALSRDDVKKIVDAYQTLLEAGHV